MRNFKTNGLGYDVENQPARHAGGWFVLAGLIATAGITHCLAGRHWQPGSPPHMPFRSTIDINQAGAAELCCIPHVGPSLAQKIVEYRQANGPFKTLCDLDKVPGIGPNLRQEIEQVIDVLDEDGPSSVRPLR